MTAIRTAAKAAWFALNLAVGKTIIDRAEINDEQVALPIDLQPSQKFTDALKMINHGGNLELAGIYYTTKGFVLLPIGAFRSLARRRKAKQPEVKRATMVPRSYWSRLPDSLFSSFKQEKSKPKPWGFSLFEVRIGRAVKA